MIQRTKSGGIFVAAALLLLSGIANAVVIEYTADRIAADTWEYRYTVRNDGAPAISIDQFSIFFALGVYADLAVSGSPGGWDSLVLQPDPGLPDDGLFDSLALISGLASGTSASGFAVQFHYLAPGTPGAQPFDIVDPSTFDTLFSGTTIAATLVAAPSTPLLLTLGLAVIGGLAHRRIK